LCLVGVRERVRAVNLGAASGRFRLALRPLDLVTLALFLTFGFALVIPGRVQAGHTLGGGDCWRAGTPTDCRTTWVNKNSSVVLRIVNQLTDGGTLWSYAGQGCAAWESAPGPQHCHTTDFTNQSYVYFKTDNTVAVGNATTWNCTSTACPHSVPTDIEWSEIREPNGNKNLGDTNISIAAHELGHALGLAHHGPEGSNQSIMTQLTNLRAPNSIDIGPLPPCSTVPVGGNGTGGVHCIYDQ